MPPEAGFVDATSRLRVAAPPEGETPEARRDRLVARIEQRVAQYKERLSDLRISTESFETYRDRGADLGDIAATVRQGAQFSRRHALVERNPSRFRELTSLEVDVKLAELEAGLKWAWLREG